LAPRSSVGFACSLTVLGPPAGTASASSTTAGLIDSNLALGSKSGYTFTLPLGSGCNASSAGINTTYDIGASPVSPGVTGQRYFCSDLSGVIQFNASAAFQDNGNGICNTGTPI